MMHICVGKLTSIGSDNCLSPGRCQAIIWTSAGILMVGSSGTNFGEIAVIEIQIFSFKKIRLKIPFVICQPFCLILNVLNYNTLTMLKFDPDAWPVTSPLNLDGNFTIMYLIIAMAFLSLDNSKMSIQCKNSIRCSMNMVQGPLLLSCCCAFQWIISMC